FSKAFDKLLHSRIISACNNFHLPSHIVNWIASFLSSRKQRVSLGEVFSSWSDVTSGIPQGSILGPILFCLAIDNLSHACPNSSIIKYADDVSILHFLRSSSDDHLQSEWDNIVSWSQSACLPLNYLKCQVVDFVTKKNLSLSTVTLTDGTLLRNVPSLSLLGVVFNCDLKWNLHVDNLVKRASQRLFILRNLRRSGCPLSVMLKCYFAFIRSVISYAFPCFCNMPSYLFSKLKRVEKRALRIMGCNSQFPPCFMTFCDELCTKLFTSVVQCEDHPLREMFSPAGSRLTRGGRMILLERVR
ncbi:MAG: reverse transcriptase domain-containing protein, partial [Pseudomonadota bacterium]